MRVPTYKAQTRLTQQTGGRAMGVRYTADDFGAGVARAQQDFFETVGDAALAVNEKQRKAAEEEQRIASGLAKDKAINEFLEESTLAAEEAKKQSSDPEERKAAGLPATQEEWYDGRIQEITARIQSGFTDEVDREDIGVRIERIAIGKRTGVRSAANTSRINSRIAEKSKTENTLINEAINAEGAELEGVLSELDGLYEDMRKGGLMTEPDIARRRKEVEDKILFQREVNTANLINDPAKAQEFIDRIEADERFDPTVRRRLASMVAGVISGNNADLSAAKSEHADNFQSLKDILETGEAIDDEQMEAFDSSAKALTAITGDPKYARDARQAIAHSEDIKMFSENMYTGAMQAVIKQSRARLKESGLSIEEKGYRAQELDRAEKFNNKMQSAFESGKGLDFLQKRNPELVQQFDFSNFSESMAKRQQEVKNLNARVGMNQMGLPRYEQNFFTESEAAVFSSVIAESTPDELSRYATNFATVGEKYPQIFEQLAGQGKGKASQFAMAAAIGDLNVASEIFRGQRIIDDGVAPIPNKSDLFEIYQDHVGDVYTYGGATDTDATIFRAALAHFISTRTSASSDILGDAEDEFISSINAVTGGIGEYGGTKYELPRGMEEDDFNDTIRGLTVDSLDLIAPDGINGYTKEQYLGDSGALRLIRDSSIRSVGGGLYQPSDLSGKPLLYFPNGEPLQFKMSDDLRNTMMSTQDLGGSVFNLVAAAQKQRIAAGLPPRELPTASEIYGSDTVTQQAFRGVGKALEQFYLGQKRRTETILSPVVMAGESVGEFFEQRGEAARAKLATESE